MIFIINFSYQMTVMNFVIKRHPSSAVPVKAKVCLQIPTKYSSDLIQMTIRNHFQGGSRVSTCLKRDSINSINPCHLVIVLFSPMRK